MDLIASLLAWYRLNARDLPWRRSADPYAVWISEIMLQQTRVAAVIPYYERFLSALPNVAALAHVDDELLHKLWEGLGYYSRARNLKRAANEVLTRFDGDFPTSYDALITLPGIGPYTAGAIASIAGGERVPAVDGNVLRVFARLHNDPRDVALPQTKAFVQAALAARMPADCPGLFNSAMMELGACVCVPNGAPHCCDCPAAAFCEARKAGTAALLPNKSGKRPRRTEEKTVFVAMQSGLCAGYRRAPGGVLAGLWQLPDRPGILSVEQAAELMGEWGMRPVGELSMYARKHIFTHIEWHMRVYCAEVDCPALPADWRWLDESCALPTAYRVCLEKTARYDVF